MAKTPWDYSRHMGKYGTPAGVKQGAAVGAYIKEQIAEERGYGKGVRDPQFYKRLKAQGVSPVETPLAFLGAYSANLLGDVLNEP
jgi:hypothetical protein